jgi:phage terminase large subunit GpA-like protein
MKKALRVATPPPDLTVSEWADEFRRLSPEASAEPGKWSTARAEYQRGMMDAVSDPRAETVVFMTSSQIGKTEIVNNICAYHISQDAAPVLVVQPTLEMAKSWSQERLAPMIRDTDSLSGLIADSRTRDSGNTMLHKVFPNGHLSIVGANSAAGLASRPIRIVLMDEVDRYPLSAGAEGDPVQLAIRRSATFWNRKIIMVSTPTNKDESRIEQAFLESDQRKYHVPCRDCGEYQVLDWKNVQWQKDQPETAGYVCEHCGSFWDDAARYNAVKRGKWKASAPFTGTIGFHLSGLYSPWTPLAQAAQEFLQSKADPMRLKTWINTYLGQSWEEDGEGVTEETIHGRESFDPNTLPEEVVLITAGVDVQDDRLEVEYLGHGRDGETYSLDYKILYGDPSSPQVWGLLDTALRETWDHPRGVELPVRCACIDSGGHHTNATYTFVKPREGQRIFAIKGVGGEGRPHVGKPSKNNRQSVRLFPVGVDGIKDLVYSRLRITEPGPGYCHFPIGRSDEYFAQLTAEKLVTRYRKGYKRKEWVQTRPRNEALDCRVYAIAALAILNLNVNSLANRFAQKAAEEQTKEPDVKEEKPQFKRSRQRPIRNQGGFANSWR